MNKLMILVFLILISVGFVDAADLVGCGHVIGQSGEYKLVGGHINYFGDCVDITTSNVVLTCDDKVYSSSGANDKYGVYISATESNRLSNITIKNCKFQTFAVGVFGGYVDNLVILNNNFTNTFDGLATGGINLVESNNVRIDGNLIKSLNTEPSGGYSGGIYVRNSVVNISNNKIESDESIGISLNGCYNSIINNNILSELNGFGSYLDNYAIWINDSHISKLYSNSISDFKSGIKFEFSNNNWQVYNNNVDGCKNGFDIFIPHSEDFEKNNISSNYITNSDDYGLFFYRDEPVGSVLDTKIYNNYFSNDNNAGSNTDNLQGVKFNLDSPIDGSSIIDSPVIAGNFWTNPFNNGHSDTCVNTISDWICDTFFSSSYVYDLYPLTNLGLKISVNPTSIVAEEDSTLTITNSGVQDYNDDYYLVLTQLSPFMQVPVKFTDLTYNPLTNIAEYTISANTFASDDLGKLRVNVRDTLKFDEATYSDSVIIDITHTESTCGDGDLDFGEQCDGSSLDGKDCTDFGFTNPDGLGCYPNTANLGCTFDIDLCDDEEEESNPEPPVITDPPVVGPDQYLVNEPCEEDSNPDDEFGTSDWIIYNSNGNPVGGSDGSGTVGCILEKEKIPFFGAYSFVLFISVLVIFYAFKKKQ